MGRPEADSESQIGTRVSESLRVELGAGEHMRGSADTGMADDGGAAPEREECGGADEGGSESRNHRWVGERVCEERRIRENGERADGRRNGKTSEGEGEGGCRDCEDRHERGWVVVANAKPAY